MGISPCGSIEEGAGVCVLVDAYSCAFFPPPAVASLALVQRTHNHSDTAGVASAYTAHRHSCHVPLFVRIMHCSMHKFALLQQIRSEG